MDLDQLDKEQKHALVTDMLDKKRGNLDMDWSEMTEMYDLDITADTLRKAAVGLKLADDAGMFDEKAPAETSAETVKTEDTALMDRLKTRDLIRQMNALNRAQARSEALRETIANAITSLPHLSHTQQYEVSDKDADQAKGKALILALGDVHFGAEWTVRGIHGEVINRVDADVLSKRIMFLATQLEEILVKTGLGTDIHLFFVGDILDGMLRQSQLMRLQYGIVESTMRVAELLSEFVAKIASCGSRVYVHAVTGNHSEIRPLGSKKGDFVDENLEKVVFWYMEERLKENENIVFDGKCSDMQACTICGYDFVLLHGDNASGINTVARDIVNMYGKPVDYFVCGHKHQEAESFSGVTSDGNSVIIRVPSICGVDPYAHSKMFGGYAGATAMLIEENYGRRCVWPLKVN